jgi:sirohydrochlorin ferrochelatase
MWGRVRLGAVDVPVLIACAHGTRDPSGQAAVAALRDEVAALLPGVDVRPAFVDVEEPGLEHVLADLASHGRPAVVVPLLLSAGYHVHVDIAQAIDVARAAGAHVTRTPALGPDPALTALLAQRLDSVDAEIVLAAAGSSDARALADVGRTAADLSARLDRPVVPAYLAAASPMVADAVAAARARGRRVAVAAYLLAPGHFATRLAECGADVITPPLLPDPTVAHLVAARYTAVAR